MSDMDLLLWLHAESEWWLSQYKHDVTLWKRQVDELTELADDSQEHARACLGKARAHAAERETLRVRIDAALAVPDQPNNVAPRHDFSSGWKHAIDAVRAALLGGQSGGVS